MANKSAPEHIWEQQPGEGAKPFEAFKIYLHMGNDRSLRKVEQQLNKSHALIGRWSSAWNWTIRAREYDAWQTQQEQKAQRSAAQKMRTRQLQTAQLIQKKAVEALDKIDMSALKPADILRFVIEGAKLEREITAMTAEEMLQSSSQQTSASLADTIVEAYKRRKEEEGS